MGLKYLPQVDTLLSAVPDGAVIVISNDGSQLTQNVQEQLEREFCKVVVLSPPGRAEHGLRNLVHLAGSDDAAVKQAVASIVAQYGAIAGFIHLHPHFEIQHGNFAQHFKAEKDILQTVFLLAKYLQAQLCEANFAFRKAFITVSRMDGKLGLGKRHNTSIFAGGLSGLVKSLNLEWSSVFCRALDIAPEMTPQHMAQHIALEWRDANLRHTEIGICAEGRSTFETCSESLPEGATIQVAVNADDVFLVSGGGRGVTASCIIEMAKKFHNKFILIGRSDIKLALPAYAHDSQGEADLKNRIMADLKARGEKADIATLKKIYNNIIAKQEIDATMAQIQAAGGKVAYVSGDVCNLLGVEEQLQALQQQMGKITGVIHGAGMLADKLIQNKTERDFDNVLSVKVDGLLSMLQVVDIQKLKHLVLFSSVAGFYGNTGQTDYAMANEILSKAAHLFKQNHPGTKVSAINWGAWEGGMVSPELKRKFLEAGVVLVNHAGGAAMFINELNQAYDAQPQVIIGGTLPTPQSALTGDLKNQLKTFVVKRTLRLEDNPFLNHHVIQGNAVLPVVNAAAWIADTCVNCYPDFKLHKMENFQLFKGIIFASKQDSKGGGQEDGQERRNYFTEAKEIAKSSDTIVFEVTISSKESTDGGQSAKLPVFHYKATVTLKNTRADRLAFVPKQIRAGNAIAGQKVYADGTLFHGEYFQGIEEVLDYSDTHLLVKCKAAALPWAAQGQFPVNTVNTFFADIQYQGMLVWVAKHHKGAKSLPLHTSCATVYNDMPFDKTLFVQIDIVENSPHRMSANCSVYDDSGMLYVKTEGAAVTISNSLQW